MGIPDVDGMLNDMCWTQYVEWYAFYLKEPFGDIKDQYYLSQLVYSSYRAIYPEANFELDNFIFRLVEPEMGEYEADDEPISDDELKRKMKSIG